MAARCDRKAVVFPGLEPADDVTGSGEAKLDEVARGENRGVAVVADEDQLLVAAAEVPVAPRAIQGDPPLEHRPWDVHAPRDDAVEVAGVLRADVDDDPVDCGC
jgi:hypothetical protein